MRAHPDCVHEPELEIPSPKGEWKAPMTLYQHSVFTGDFPVAPGANPPPALQQEVQARAQDQE